MRFTIKDKVFPVEINVYVNLTEKEIVSLVKREKLHPDAVEMMENPGWMSHFHDGCIAIVFNDMPLKLRCEDAAVVAHECCHATFAIMKFIGESAVDAEETFCYYTQFLTEKILRKINNKYKNELRKRNKQTQESDKT